MQIIDPKKFRLGSHSLAVLREDELHPIVSGNKFRKLKYNIAQCLKEGKSAILTFGGAYSNHIAAVAAAGNAKNIRTIGVIRGEEMEGQISVNPTLNFAQSCQMELHFVSRLAYNNKNDDYFIAELSAKFGDFYLIPEGGTNKLAVKGCEEILSSQHDNFDYICTSVGTGGTIAGLVKASKEHQTVIGFSALKGRFQISEIEKHTKKNNYYITDDYCFGGYAKIDVELIRFMNEFYKKSQICLDPVYTGKMIFGIMDLIKKKKLKENSRILAVHTGGLQGIEGMNLQLKKKNLPQIITEYDL